MSTRDDRRRDNLRDIQPMATLILAYQGLKATAVSVMATSYIVIVCNWVGASHVLVTKYYKAHLVIIPTVGAYEQFAHACLGCLTSHCVLCWRGDAL